MRLGVCLYSHHQDSATILTSRGYREAAGRFQVSARGMVLRGIPALHVVTGALPVGTRGGCVCATVSISEGGSLK